MKRTPLKPGGPLTRRTPLTSTASLPRTPLPRSTRPVQPPVARPATPRAPRHQTGPQKAVQEAVAERDGWACVPCGSTRDLSVHHRTNRGAGGSSLAAANLPGNLLLACWPCNSGMEADADAAARAVEAGWKVRRSAGDPCAVPVRYPGGWWLLDNEGGRTITGPPT